MEEEEADKAGAIASLIEKLGLLNIGTTAEEKEAPSKKKKKETWIPTSWKGSLFIATGKASVKEECEYAWKHSIEFVDGCFHMAGLSLSIRTGKSIALKTDPITVTDLMSVDSESMYAAVAKSTKRTQEFDLETCVVHESRFEPIMNIRGPRCVASKSIVGHAFNIVPWIARVSNVAVSVGIPYQAKEVFTEKLVRSLIKACTESAVLVTPCTSETQVDDIRAIVAKEGAKVVKEKVIKVGQVVLVAMFELSR